MGVTRIIKRATSVTILVLLLYYVIDIEGFNWSYLNNFSDLIIFLVILIAGLYMNGLQLYIMLKNQSVNLSLIDQFLLPVSMALFGYLVPVNGGMLFSLFFMKKKLSVDIKEGLSIGVYSLYISFLLTGLIGFLYCIFYNNQLVVILPLSFILILFPLIVNIITFNLDKVKLKKMPFLGKVTGFLRNVSVSSNSQFKNRRSLIQLLIINVLMIVVHIASTYWLISMLNLKVPLLSVALITLFMRMSSLVRVFPGNIGIDELFAGGIFAFFGLSPSDGIVLVIYSRVIALLFLLIPGGLLHIYLNRKVLKLENLKDLKGIFTTT